MLTFPFGLLFVLLKPEQINTNLPSSLKDMQIPSNAIAGDLLDMGPAIYYGFKAHSYKLIVPENRKKADSRLIALPVVKIHALNRGNQPVFHLSGGPGMSNMRFKEFGDMIENHDIILVGYRGADSSVILQAENVIKALKEMVKTDLLSDKSLNLFKEAVTADYEIFKNRGVDINGYNMVEVVDDLESVRISLQYDKINLLSESYGTRLAQIYSTRYGSMINRSVMIGINPPGHFLFSPTATDDIIFRILSEVTAK